MDSKSTTELHRALSEVVWCLGFEHFMFGLQLDGRGVEQPRQVVINGYPVAWRERYLQQNYIRVDPTVTHCLASTEPLMWTDDLVTPESAQMWEEAASHGLRYGLSLAVHERGGTISMFSIARRTPIAARELRWVANTSRAIAATVHFAAANLPVEEDAHRVRRLLTPRELEVLALAATGLNSPGIAAMLNITPRTVNYHMGIVLGKLNCRTRGEAIGMAAGLGLFDKPTPLGHRTKPVESAGT